MDPSSVDGIEDTSLPRASYVQMESESRTAESRSLWNDERLIERLKRRESEAIAHAVETYAPKLYRYALYQLGDATAAEDLTSEVVTRMLEKIDTLTYTGVPFQAWLFSIARNLVS